MLWSRRYDAFISYSHNDDAIVRPLVELLSVNERRVFWDQNLKAGDRWGQMIRSSIKHSNIFVLFWCCDTRQSDYVAEEIAHALLLKKKIVPVTLCAAALPRALAEWQWIDLRESAHHVCGDADHQNTENDIEAIAPPPPAPASVKRSKWAVWLVITAIILLLLAISTTRIHRAGNPPSVLHSSAPRLDGWVLTDGLRIPRGAIRIRLGKSYVLIYPPQDMRDGAIVEFNGRGKVIDWITVPGDLPAVAQPEFHEVAMPWWYTNRVALISAISFTAIAAFFTWVISSRRRRASETLHVTMEYLNRLSQET